MQQTLIQQGLDLTFYGMGVVFVFLTLLVICTMVMSLIVEKFFPEPEPEIPVASFSTNRGPVSPRVLAVIQAAIHEHRARTQK